MRLNELLKILPKLAPVLALSILSGCGTAHIITKPDTTGVTLENVKALVALPDRDGVLTPGQVELPAGTLFRAGLTQPQVIQELIKAGLKLPPDYKP